MNHNINLEEFDNYIFMYINQNMNKLTNTAIVGIWEIIENIKLDCRIKIENGEFANNVELNNYFVEKLNLIVGKVK